MYFYKYKVKFYNDISQQNNIEHGIVPASTFIDAVSCLVKYYGEDELLDIKIKIMMDENIGDASQDILITKREG